MALPGNKEPAQATGTTGLVITGPHPRQGGWTVDFQVFPPKDPNFPEAPRWYLVPHQEFLHKHLGNRQNAVE